MAVCAFVIRERGRKCLGNLLMFLNLIISIMGLIIIFAGMYLGFLFYQRKDLLKDYDYKKMTKFVTGMGLALLLFHLVGAKLCFDCGNYKTRHRFQGFLIFYILALFVAMASIIAMTISCSSHRSKVAHSFEKGFLQLMDAYSTDIEKKNELDMLQITHKCCGSNGYADWTEFEWYPNDYIRPEHQKTASGSEKHGNTIHQVRGVPFTCCSTTKMGPCIHDIVEKARPGYKATKGKMFYSKGCGEAMTGDIQKVLRVISLWGLIPFWIELLMAILTKYLYTSINNAVDNGDPKGPGYGYMMEKCPLSACSVCECEIQEVQAKKTKGSSSSSDSDTTEEPEQ